MYFIKIRNYLKRNKAKNMTLNYGKKRTKNRRSF